MTITKKMISIYVTFSVCSVILTSFFAFVIFQKLLDNQMSAIDLNTSVIKDKFEEIYSNNSFELPNLHERYRNYDPDSPKQMFKEKLEQEMPGYDLEIEFVEGVLQYKETPKLIYDNSQKKYFFQTVREIKFNKSIPYNSLQLSIKFNFYSIIVKSLIYGALLTTLILLPLMMIVSRAIVKPISSISKGAKKIAEGALGIQVKHKAKDEIGELSRSFNYMSNELSKIKTIRDDLLATISHELRTPLSRISGYTEILLDIEVDKDEEIRYYKSILQEIDLLNNMAAEIIEISRLELNKEELYLEKIDLGFFLEMLQEDMEMASKSKNVALQFQYSYGYFCNIDVEKIRRVLNNAIQNSINAEASEIKISTDIIKSPKSYESDIIKISISDNGKGIPEEHMDLVFEKFYRVDKSRDRQTGGFGLGLAICKGLIKEHKGDVYFSAQEKGACLNIELPLIDEFNTD